MNEPAYLPIAAHLIAETPALWDAIRDAIAPATVVGQHEDADEGVVYLHLRGDNVLPGARYTVTLHAHGGTVTGQMSPL